MLLLTVYSVLLLPKPTLSPTFGHMVSPPPFPPSQPTLTLPQNVFIHNQCNCHKQVNIFPSFCYYQQLRSSRRDAMSPDRI